MDKDEARAVLARTIAVSSMEGERMSVPASVVIDAMLAFAAEARADQKERDARVAEGLKAEFADAENAGNDEAEEAWHGGMVHAANRVAAAIRSQDHD